MSYDKTISADLYDQKWEDGTITITMKRGASVPVIIIKVTGAELTGSYTLSEGRRRSSGVERRQDVRALRRQCGGILHQARRGALLCGRGIRGLV